MEFDLVIYGATGFTGTLSTKRLTKKGQNENLRIAIAGRNQQKLEQLQASCEVKPGIINADSADIKAIEAMVQRTKVVLNFAGPFALYAEPVIAACAKYGKDYLDITGETPFIRSMIEKYQQQALSTGSRLIPFSGFDSVPADLGVYRALAIAKDKDIMIDDMCHYYLLKGGLNGGTLASALNAAESKQELGAQSLIPSNSRKLKKSIAFKPIFEPMLQRWSAPFFMGPINQAVVERSIWLRSEIGESVNPFQYQERVLVGKGNGYLKASFVIGVLIGLRLLTMTSLGRTLLRRFGPKPGEGPSEEIRRNGITKGQLICRSQGESKMILGMEYPGDPGNEATVAMANASALLATENAFVDNRKGFLTPTTAFGDRLMGRLEASGFKFSTEFV